MIYVATVLVPTALTLEMFGTLNVDEDADPHRVPTAKYKALQGPVLLQEEPLQARYPEGTELPPQSSIVPGLTMFGNTSDKKTDFETLLNELPLETSISVAVETVPVET